MLVFKDFMSEANFVKWYSDHPQYQFDQGQEPQEGDFSSKKVYRKLLEDIKAAEITPAQLEAYRPPAK